MKQIHSAGKDWLFVPVPKECTYKINDKGHLSVIKQDGTEDIIFLSWEVWSIFSTLSEALANEELGLQIVDFEKDVVFDNEKDVKDYVLYAMNKIIELHSIDPSTHWLILKKEA